MSIGQFKFLDRIDTARIKNYYIVYDIHFKEVDAVRPAIFPR